jgi:hypothetical protein
MPSPDILCSVAGLVEDDPTRKEATSCRVKHCRMQDGNGSLQGVGDVQRVGSAASRQGTTPSEYGPLWTAVGLPSRSSRHVHNSCR